VDDKSDDGRSYKLGATGKQHQELDQLLTLRGNDVLGETVGVERSSRMMRPPLAKPARER
jgi:hypothetical protein